MQDRFNFNETLNYSEIDETMSNNSEISKEIPYKAILYIHLSSSKSVYLTEITNRES